MNMEKKKIIADTLEIIDKNKELLSNGDYLNTCNSLQRIYNNNNKPPFDNVAIFNIHQQEIEEPKEFDKTLAILVKVDYVDINFYNRSIDNLILFNKIIKDKFCYMLKADYQTYNRSKKGHCFFFKIN